MLDQVAAAVKTPNVDSGIFDLSWRLFRRENGVHGVSDQEMSLHAAMFGGGAEGERVARMFEGLLMAEVLMTLDRFGVADVLAARPRTAAELAPEVGASADPLGRLLAAASVYRLVRRDDDGRYALTSAGELRAEHEALLGPCGYRLVRDTRPSADNTFRKIVDRVCAQRTAGGLLGQWPKLPADWLVFPARAPLRRPGLRGRW